VNDIVERLRAEGALAGHYDAPAIQREAADEIERLRAERDRLIHLAHIAIEYAYKQGHAEAKGHIEVAAECAPLVEQFKKTARAALGENQT
jgi:cell fate (sporulation/competence/biofilm development) regulator YmcA (YheA/YmcA/DUF963 family)